MKNKLLPTLHKNAHTGAGKHGEGGLNLQTALIYAPSPPPARRQVVLGCGSGQKTHVGSGTRLLKRWKLRNPVGPSSRMSLVSSILTMDWHTKVSSLVWRERVIGRRVLLYLHQRSARGTDEIASGLSAAGLMGTLTKSSSARSDRFRSKAMSPQEMIGLLPTLTVGAVTGGNKCRSGDRKDELLLPGIIKGLAPTLQASDAKTAAGCTQDYIDRCRGTGKAKISEICADQQILGTCTGYRLSATFALWWMMGKEIAQEILSKLTEPSG